MRQSLVPASALIMATALLGCTVGPDFQKPQGPAVTRYTKEEALAPAAGPQLVTDRDIPADWWSLFRSPPLDALIRQTIRQNPDLAAAQASLRVAMENVKAQSAAFYPSITAGLDGTRNRQSAQLSPVLASSELLYSLYQAQLGFSWTPDIWGGTRRSVEALQAAADAQRYQVEATYLALAANVTAAAIQEASLRAQIAATQAIIQDQQEILAIERKQHLLGQISGQEIAAQETLLAQTQATLPPLQKQLAQQRDLLTVLAGRYPQDEIAQSFSLDQLTVTAPVPVSLPVRLAEQRPDIRMAQENLHAASAQIGVAVAARLPNVTLSANVGSVATQFGQLFDSASGFWTVGAGLTEPLFDGGLLAHREQAARAEFDRAAAVYRSTLLSAFQNVADVLQALQSDSETLRLASTVLASADKSLALARTQLALGQTARLALLNAQVVDSQARLALATARANQLSDIAALMQALGGGWWNKPERG